MKKKTFQNKVCQTGGQTGGGKLHLTNENLHETFVPLNPEQNDMILSKLDKLVGNYTKIQ